MLAITGMDATVYEQNGQPLWSTVARMPTSRPAAVGRQPLLPFSVQTRSMRPTLPSALFTDAVEGTHARSPLDLRRASNAVSESGLECSSEARRASAPSTFPRS